MNYKNKKYNLKKFSEKSERNSIDLDKKLNKVFTRSNQGKQIKSSRIIYETDWNLLEEFNDILPDGNGVYYVNEKDPLYWNTWIEEDGFIIETRNSYAPFLNIETLYMIPDNIEISAGIPMDLEVEMTDYPVANQVRGDSVVIYQGGNLSKEDSWGCSADAGLIWNTDFDDPNIIYLKDHEERSKEVFRILLSTSGGHFSHPSLLVDYWVGGYLTRVIIRTNVATQAILRHWYYNGGQGWETGITDYTQWEYERLDPSTILFTFDGAPVYKSDLVLYEEELNKYTEFTTHVMHAPHYSIELDEVYKYKDDNYSEILEFTHSNDHGGILPNGTIKMRADELFIEWRPKPGTRWRYLGGDPGYSGVSYYTSDIDKANSDPDYGYISDSSWNPGIFWRGNDCPAPNPSYWERYPNDIEYEKYISGDNRKVTKTYNILDVLSAEKNEIILGIGGFYRKYNETGDYLGQQEDYGYNYSININYENKNNTDVWKRFWIGESGRSWIYLDKRKQRRLCRSVYTGNNYVLGSMRHKFLEPLEYNTLEYKKQPQVLKPNKTVKYSDDLKYVFNSKEVSKRLKITDFTSEYFITPYNESFFKFVDLMKLPGKNYYETTSTHDKITLNDLQYGTLYRYQDAQGNEHTFVNNGVWVGNPGYYFEYAGEIHRILQSTIKYKTRVVLNLPIDYNEKKRYKKKT